MRTLFLLFTIVFLAFTAFSQKKQTDLEYEGLKGKVKSVQGSSTYLGTKDKPVKTPKRQYYSINFYGLDGNVTEELELSLGLKYVYQFVDGFLSVKEIVVDETKVAKIKRGTTVGIEENTETPVKTIKPDERFITRLEYEYDENGRRELRRIFSSDGKMDSITHYSFNPAGLLEKEIYKNNGSKWSYFYLYDTNGNLNEKTMKRSNSKDVVDMTDRTEYSDYKFDVQGNWIERKYTKQYEYNGSTTISEGIEYRNITYYQEIKPKKTVSKKKKR